MIEGTWTLTAAYSETWQSSITFSSAAGSKIKFNFTGTELRIIGYNAANRSTSIDVYVDEVLVRNFSADGSQIIAQVLNADISGLADSEHSVVIINNATGGTGGIFFLDAVDIDVSGTLKPYNADIVPIFPAPRNLITTSGDSRVTINWSAVTGETGYNVKRATTAGGPYTTIASNVPATSYVDDDLVNGTTYYYVVTAITADEESSESNEASATPEAAPVEEGQVILRITMNDSSEREYKVSKVVANDFVAWCN
ncbi:MAG: Carbohydrate binding family 6 [Sporomusa sp.]|jgi:hypothetical protein|nr:Carbohydrate binding family 6 [Sporomusa sp.]MDF2876753.1 Carbohydrate binding family 6 [Sporomusa sp.]